MGATAGTSGTCGNWKVSSGLEFFSRGTVGPHQTNRCRSSSARPQTGSPLVPAARAPAAAAPRACSARLAAAASSAAAAAAGSAHGEERPEQCCSRLLRCRFSAGHARRRVVPDLHRPRTNQLVAAHAARSGFPQARLQPRDGGEGRSPADPGERTVRGQQRQLVVRPRR